MFMKRMAALMVMSLVLMAGMAYSADVSMKISGPGAVDATTIKAGQKVTFDVYITNEIERRGLSIGFKFYSPDSTIKSISHPADSGKGMDNTKGDVKSWGPYAGSKTFDVLNAAVTDNWDGTLPDVMGFMAHIMYKKYMPHENMKAYSMDVIVPNAGTLAVDSSFFEPGGNWMMVTEATEPEPHRPTWNGPYTFKVVK
ncbi:MAG: hypothetical protein IPH75_14940 [bacterium]|nr:hypothetical protein [bacterium]